LCMVGAVLGALRRNVITVHTLLWTPLLLTMGYVYLLRIPLLNLTNLGAILIMFYLPVGLIIGSAIEELATILPHRRVLACVALVIFLAAGLVGARDRSTTVEFFRFFVMPADVAAMQWINENTLADALFAVNTHFWLPHTPHGTDGGYWIPYFTGRRTTTGVMLNHLAPRPHRNGIVGKSHSVKRLEQDSSALDELRQWGVNYIYIGSVSDSAPEGLDPSRLSMIPGLKEVYTSGGVHIFYITKEKEEH
jgi:hypothetical protein